MVHQETFLSSLMLATGSWDLKQKSAIPAATLGREMGLLQILWHYGPNKMQTADNCWGRLEYCIWEEQKKHLEHP